ncbi:hypothetical protein DL770_008920 [Monosporascus sp. CRB-9-2]|nr:hypothetical protein DL770_008920 [Monosporascus sp. CRB-9-2]
MKLWLHAGLFALGAKEVSAHGGVYFYVIDGVAFNGARPSWARHAPAKAGGAATAPYDNDCAWDGLELGFYCNPEDEDRECPEGHSSDFLCMYHFWYHALGPALAYTGGLRRGLRAGGGRGLPAVV